jgi:hypothetical protein
MSFQGILNEKLPLMTAVLSSANIAENPVDALKAAIAKDGRIHTVIGYLLNPKFNMELPEGVPPYIPSDTPLGMSELDVLRLDKKIYIMYSSDTRRMRKEEIFIQWLEQMAAEEAKILIAVKDKSLVELYPNLTERVLVDAMQWPFEQYEAMKKR